MGCHAMQWTTPETEAENVGHDGERVSARDYTVNLDEDWSTSKGFQLGQGTPFG